MYVDAAPLAAFQVPELSAFFLLTAFPSLACVAYLTAVQRVLHNDLPLDVAVGIPMIAFVVRSSAVNSSSSARAPPLAFPPRSSSCTIPIGPSSPSSIHRRPTSSASVRRRAGQAPLQRHAPGVRCLLSPSTSSSARWNRRKRASDCNRESCCLQSLLWAGQASVTTWGSLTRHFTVGHFRKGRSA